MLCIECGAVAEKGYTTDVTDLGNCLVIIRNVINVQNAMRLFIPVTLYRK